MNAIQMIFLAVGIIASLHLAVIIGLVIAYFFDDKKDIDHEDFLG